MVVCPLAVLDNWAKEFARFAPDIPVVTYYGTKEERAEIRRTQMAMDEVDLEFYRGRATSHAAAMAAAAAAAPSKGKGKGKEKAAGSSKEAGIGDIDEDASEDDEVDIDYNLAKNLLESFKGQAGMVGPVGTMLADMGIRLPRDESDDEDEAEGSK